MKIFINNLFIIILFFCFNVFSMDTFFIKNVYVNGLKNLDLHNLISNTFFTKKKIFSNKDISNFIKLLYSTGNFNQIKMFRDKYDLIIKVKERPIISSLSITGNKSIDYKLLRNNLYLYNIDIGKPLNNFLLLSFEKKMNNLYQDIGKYNTRIKFFCTPLENNRVNLKLLIVESESAKIQRINLLGNKSFSLKYLTKICGIKKIFLGLDLFYKNYYNKEKFINIIKKLHDFYVNHGYVCFRINSTQLNLSPDNKNIYITINLHEGEKYNISDIIINNDFEHPYKINNLISIKNNEIYDFSKIMSIVVNIKKILGRFGYIHPFINVKTKINHQNKTVKLYFNIDNGKRYYVEKISFVGNFLSKDTTLRYEIRQMEDSLFNVDLVNNGIFNLKRTGYFKDVNVEIKDLSYSKNKVNVIYKVKEISTGSFNIGLGYNHARSLSFNFSLNKNNLFGMGHNIEFNIIKNSNQDYGKLGLTSLHFIDDNINISNNIIYNNFTPSNDIYSSNYIRKNYLFNNMLVFNLNSKNSFGLGLEYTFNSLSNIRPQVMIWRYLKSMGKRLNYLHRENFTSNDIILDYNFIFDNLNKQIYPIYGNYNKLDTKITIPGSKNSYYQMIFDSYEYFPIDADYKWILSNHIYLGYGNGFGNKEMPFHQNFYAGGIDTVRGFAINSIGPRAVYYNPIYLDINSNEQSFYNSSDVVGGNSIIVTNTELILPNFFIKDEYTKNIRYSIFIDTGMVLDTNWNNYSNFDLSNIPDYSDLYNIHISTGFSLRWISPIGPLMFSYSIPVKVNSMDILEKFQFSMGKMW